MNEKYAILMPAYNPPSIVVDVVEELVQKFKHVFLVNDGSQEASRPLFEKLEAINGVTLLTHKINQG